MFNSLLIYNLQNSEFIQFTDYLLEIIKTQNPEQLKVTELHEKIRKKHELLASIYKPDRGSDITPKIQEADERRDAAINGISGALEAFTYHFRPEKRKAAGLLLREINKHGSGIARMNYQAQTGTIESITSQWKSTPEYGEAQKTLGITDWVEELDTANQVFKNYYLERLRENAENPDVQIKEIRKEIVRLYRLLLSQLEVHATLQNDEIYEATVRSINELIDRYNQVIFARKSADDETEEEGTTETKNN
ncbi:MAG: DUF6261 family protein [Marinilabilia sp.]